MENVSKGESIYCVSTLDRYSNFFYDKLYVVMCIWYGSCDGDDGEGVCLLSRLSLLDFDFQLKIEEHRWYHKEVGRRSWSGLLLAI